jgi:ATP-dependent DNA helicase RecQ
VHPQKAFLIMHQKNLKMFHETSLYYLRLFTRQVEELKQRAYELKEAKVNFIVYWTDGNTKQEIKMILPEVLFHRKILE